MVQSGSGSGRDQRDEPDFDGIKNRLDDLDEKLEHARDQETQPDSIKRGEAMGRAFRLTVELLAGVGGGLFWGWLLDSWFGTSPLLLIVFLLMGVAAGLLNAVKAAQQMQKDQNTGR